MAEPTSPEKSAEASKSSRLIVKGLPKYITDQRLKRLFDPYGVVTDCQLKYSPDGRFRGFAFVGFLTVESAESAACSLDGTFVDTARIHVHYCQRFYPSARSEKLTANNQHGEKPSSTNSVCIESSGILKRKQVLIFLAPTKPAKLTLSADGRTATVRLSRRSDVEAVLKLDGQFLGGNRLRLSEWQGSDASSNNDQKRKRPNFPPEDAQKQANAIADSGAIFVRNLAYQCTESDLRSLFEAFGPIADIDYPTDSSSGKPKGFGTVRFVFPENALKAFTECDGTIFQGRVLHILANAEKEDEKPMVDSTGTSDYKDEKRLKEKQSQSDIRTWNTLFLGPNAVVDVLADRLDAKKSEILDPTSSSSLGVRVALGEAQIVRETVHFLEQHGVVLDSFQGAAVDRSDRVILVKNIPAGTTAAELGDIFKKYGRLGRLVRPPHGLSAIVEFLDSKRAKSAYSELAFKRFKHKPLYLEWAPAGVFSTQYDSREEKEEGKEESKEEEGEEPNEIYQQCTLFVKNLNAQTNDQSLAGHFKKLGTVVSASVVKKYAKSERGKGKPADQFSLCYGFVTYKKPEEAREALKRLQGSRLDGNELEIQISQRPTGPKQARLATEPTSKGSHSQTTILVRNIPFQANRKEIQQVFKIFGPLKVVRIPKKASSTQHRGFGFVEYASKADAEKAMAALGGSTHLYGRRLVLEWADAVGDLDELRKRTADYFASGQSRQKAKMMKIE